MYLTVYTILFNILEQYTPNFGYISADVYSASTFTILLLFLPDIIVFCGIILLIAYLGMNITSPRELLNTITYISYNCIIFAVIVLLGSIIIIFYDVNLLIINNVNWNTGIYLLQNTLVINIYTQVSKFIITIILLILYKYINIILLSKYTSNSNELVLLLHISLFLSYIIISCTHFVILLLALEGFSLILYILTTIDRSHGGVIAAVKYFTFGTLGSIFLFWGVVHLYSLFPALTYSSIKNVYTGFNTYLLLFSYELSLNFISIAIIIGFLIKLGAAPLHQWVPDVYAGSNLLITAVFSTFVKFLLFIIFCRVAYLFESNIIISFFSFNSLIIGGILTLKQLEIKRFLAYSSITHVGFLLMGDLPSVLIYMLTYICSSLLLFSVLFSVRIYTKELTFLSELRLIKNSGLWNTSLLVIALASMAGLPPFSGFFGKFLIWGSLIEDIYLFNDMYSYGLLMLSILLTLIIIFYYMRIIIYLYISSDFESINTNTKETNFIQQAILCILVVFWLLIQSKIISICYIISYNIIINIQYS